MVIEVIDPIFETLIDPAGDVQCVRSGFEFLEGPVWHPGEQALYFSDILGNARWRMEGGRFEKVLERTDMANGLTFDPDGALLSCDHASSTVSRYRDGEREIIASRFEGHELNSPNDIVVRSDGAIYFTDPTFGRMSAFGVKRDKPLGFQGVYRIAPEGGAPELVAKRETYTQPNGLCFSPDETALYVNDTMQANIRKYDVADDGTLTGERIFAEGISDDNRDGRPDGMKSDEAGNIWVTGPGGLWIYNPAGDVIGRIETPEVAANHHWGGPDFTTLYICARTSLYAVETKTRPHAEPYMKSLSS